MLLSQTPFLLAPAGTLVVEELPVALQLLPAALLWLPYEENLERQPKLLLRPWLPTSTTACAPACSCSGLSSPGEPPAMLPVKL